MSARETQSSTKPERFEQQAFGVLETEKDLYAPLEVRSVKRNTRGASVLLRWQGRETRFGVAIKARTAPKIVQEAFWRLRDRPNEERQSFLLIVPFITDSIREMVEQEKVSCLDLSGNYLIQSPEFLAIRLDRKNRFPESAPIKKIYSGNSSQVGRLFLREKRAFKSVGEIFEAINRSADSLSLSAVSKVLSGLAEELIIEKATDRIVLLQPEKLLDRLRTGYTPPRNLSTLKLNIPGTPDVILKTLAGELTKEGNIWMLSGESSATQYASTTPPAVFRAYSFQSGDLPKFEDERFYNVILEGRTEPFIFFDRQVAKNKVCWASRLQTYLELSNLDKREREIAESIREDILKEFR